MTEEELHALEGSLGALKSRMASVSEAFIGHAIPFLIAWYDETVIRAIMQDPEHTEQLPAERLSALKAELRELQANATGVAGSLLRGDEAWWHKTPTEDAYRRERSLDKAVRLAAGLLGPILQKYGYLRARSRMPREEWLEYDSTGQHHPPNARPYYPYSMTWSDEMQTSSQEYGALVTEGEPLLSRIQQAKESIKRGRAKDLWDSA